MSDDDKHVQMASQVMVEIARRLRQKQTSVEERLWEVLRNRRLGELKFRRQYPVPYTAFVVDFYCHDAQLIIEIDGSIHQMQQAEDELRQSVLKDNGYQILRFENEEVMSDLESVLVRILQAISETFPLLGERDKG